MSLTKNTRIVHLYLKQSGKCYYCQIDLCQDTMPVIDFNVDHKQPTSRGGKDSTENICLSCQPCNTAKANMTEEEYKVCLEKVAQGILEKKDIPEYVKFLVLKSKFERAPNM